MAETLATENVQHLLHATLNVIHKIQNTVQLAIDRKGLTSGL